MEYYFIPVCGEGVLCYSCVWWGSTALFLCVVREYCIIPVCGEGVLHYSCVWWESTALFLCVVREYCVIPVCSEEVLLYSCVWWGNNKCERVTQKHGYQKPVGSETSAALVFYQLWWGTPNSTLMTPGELGAPSSILMTPVALVGCAQPHHGNRLCFERHTQAKLWFPWKLGLKNVLIFGTKGSFPVWKLVNVNVSKIPTVSSYRKRKLICIPKATCGEPEVPMCWFRSHVFAGLRPSDVKTQTVNKKHQRK